MNPIRENYYVPMLVLYLAIPLLTLHLMISNSQVMQHQLLFSCVFAVNTASDVPKFSVKQFLTNIPAS